MSAVTGTLVVDQVRKDTQGMGFANVYEIEDEERFSCGDCWVLAAVIHFTMGYEMFALVEEDDPSVWHHMVVQTPDGSFLDVTGEKSGAVLEQEWSAMYGCSMVLKHWSVSMYYAEFCADEGVDVSENTEYFGSFEVAEQWVNTKFGLS